jgi:SAM-dependent methyltransferase
VLASQPPQARSAGGRKALGAWYTPHPLVRHLVVQTLPASFVAGRAVTVLDPACGDGRLLAAAAARIGAAGGRARLVGVDIDARAVALARSRLAGEDAEVIHADALGRDWSGERFDVVLGNPPFLNQMSSALTRGGASPHGGGPYANAAVEFLALAVRLADPGGRVAMVLPTSILSARDAAPVRELVSRRAAMRWAWWSDSPVFDADVRTCALGFELGGRVAAAAPVARARGRCFTDVRAVADPGAVWSRLIADECGVPPVAVSRTRGTVGDVAAFGANFRDQYYGIVGAVSDDADGPPLVTCGLIDPAACRWGERPATFGKQRFAAPRIDLAALAPNVRAWARRHLRPKVLVANQTTVIEAVVDARGAWVPSVPVINAVPHHAPDVWRVGAVLTSPMASAWAAEHAAGSGLSARSLRLSPSLLAAVPWPAGDVEPAVAALRAGDVAGCGRAMLRAYGLPGDGDLYEWWLSSVERATPSPARR